MSSRLVSRSMESSQQLKRSPKNKGTSQAAKPKGTCYNNTEDIRSRLERKSKDKIERLKLASRPSKVNVITCSDIFDSLPTTSREEPTRRHTIPSLKGKGPSKKKNRITVRPSSSSKKSVSAAVSSPHTAQKNGDNEDDDAAPIKMQESEARQLKMIESSEMPFDDLSCSQQATCNSSTDTMNDSDIFELSDFDSEETKMTYYQGRLNLEEKVLKASQQNKSGNKQVAIEQEVSNKKALDVTILKLEETKKKRRLLEAINDSLKKEELKLEEKKKQQTLEAQHQQEMNRVSANINKHEPQLMTVVNPPRPYPKSMLRQPPTTQPKNKSVTIREDLSIIQSMEDTSKYSMSSLASDCELYEEEEREGLIDVSDSVTSTGGLQRTDTFHNIFEERKYNIRRDLHSNCSKSLPAMHPSGKQKDSATGIKATLEDFDLHVRDLQVDNVRRPKPSQQDSQNTQKTRAEGVSDDEDEILSATAEELITGVLANASDIYHKSVRKVPRDSLTIKNPCKRQS